MQQGRMENTIILHICWLMKMLYPLKWQNMQVLIKLINISEHFIKAEFPFPVSKDMPTVDNNKEYSSGNIGSIQENTQEFF